MSDETPVEEPAAAEAVVPPAPTPAPAPIVLPPEIQAELDKIHAEIDAEVAKIEAAAKDEEERIIKILAAKKVCADTCGPIADALAREDDPRAQQALTALEARTHAAHADDLSAAYREFSGQREGDSNPAPVGETNLTADVSVMSAGSGRAEVA